MALKIIIRVRNRNGTRSSRFLISSSSASPVRVCHHAHWGLPVLGNNSLSTQKSIQGSKAEFVSQLGLVEIDSRKSPLSTSRRMRQDQHFHHEFTQERKTFYLRTITPFYYFTPEMNRSESAYFLRSEQNGRRFHSLERFSTSLSFAKFGNWASSGTMLKFPWSGDIAIFGSSLSRFLVDEYFELKNLFLISSLSSIKYFVHVVLKAVAADNEIFSLMKRTSTRLPQSTSFISRKCCGSLSCIRDASVFSMYDGFKK